MYYYDRFFQPFLYSLYWIYLINDDFHFHFVKRYLISNPDLIPNKERICLYSFVKNRVYHYWLKFYLRIKKRNDIVLTSGVDYRLFQLLLETSLEWEIIQPYLSDFQKFKLLELRKNLLRYFDASRLREIERNYEKILNQTLKLSKTGYRPIPPFPLSLMIFFYRSGWKGEDYLNLKNYDGIFEKVASISCFKKTSFNYLAVNYIRLKFDYQLNFSIYQRFYLILKKFLPLDVIYRIVFYYLNSFLLQGVRGEGFFRRILNTEDKMIYHRNGMRLWKPKKFLRKPNFYRMNHQGQSTQWCDLEFHDIFEERTELRTCLSRYKDCKSFLEESFKDLFKDHSYFF